MKMKLTNFYTVLFGVFVLLGIYGCQTESLNSDENLTNANSSANKRKKNRERINYRI